MLSVILLVLLVLILLVFFVVCHQLWIDDNRRDVLVPQMY